jgi:hypothetical protein
MSLTRPLPLAVCAFTMLSLNSCGLGSRVDVTNPTISEMDALDVQWGLTPRKSKGGPRRTYQYLDTGAANSATGTAPAAAPVPARESVNAAPPASTGGAAADPAPTQPVPASLR